MKKLTVDDRQRVRLPHAKPGQVFAYEPDSDGSITLVPVTARLGPRRVVAKLSKKSGGMFFQVPKGHRLHPDANRQGGGRGTREPG